MSHDTILPDAIILEEPLPDEWYLGSNKATERFGGDELNPTGDWTPYITDDEDQAIKFVFDTQGCALFHTIRPYLMLAKLQGFDDFLQNGSERYLGVFSGTNQNGTNPHTVAETLRRVSGLIPDSSMPWTKDIETFEAYYDRAQAEANLPFGRKLLEHFEFGHEWVFPFNSGLSPKQKKELLKAAIKRGPVSVSVKAWRRKGDKYTKKKGERDGHWVTGLRFDGNNLVVHDTYEPYLKTLTEDYDHDAAKVYFLKRRAPKGNESAWTSIVNFFARLLWQRG